MSILLAFPILGVLLILQSVVFSRMVLLQGTADLVLLAVTSWALHKRVSTAWHWAVIAGLLVGLVTALPPGIALLNYLMAAGIAILLRKRVWQAPVLAMFVAIFLATIAIQAVDLLALRLAGSAIPVLQAFNLVTIPSLLLNLLLALPVYAGVTDLANWLYPEELEV